MTVRDGQPSPEQARKMARVFVIATLLGGLFVFLNVAMRSYNIRMQQAELKKSGEMTTPGATAAPATQVPGETPATPETVPQLEGSSASPTP